MGIFLLTGGKEVLQCERYSEKKMDGVIVNYEYWISLLLDWNYYQLLLIPELFLYNTNWIM